MGSGRTSDGPGGVFGRTNKKFAGPCAQGVLDTVIVPRPMSLGRPGLFVLIKNNAFLGTSAHESVPLVGYLLDYRCGSRPRQTLAGSSEMALGRAGANLERQNGAIWAKNA